MDKQPVSAQKPDQETLIDTEQIVEHEQRQFQQEEGRKFPEASILSADDTSTKRSEEEREVVNLPLVQGSSTDEVVSLSPHSEAPRSATTTSQMQDIPSIVIDIRQDVATLSSPRNIPSEANTISSSQNTTAIAGGISPSQDRQTVANDTTQSMVADTQLMKACTESTRTGCRAPELPSSPPTFSYNQPHEITNCWLPSCRAPTKSSDNLTITCPRCGDHSYVRYCSASHLLSDMRDHFINHCRQRINTLFVDLSTISPVRMPRNPFIGVAREAHDSFERHRQALYHAYPPRLETINSNRLSPSYYVFSDADRFTATGLPVTVENLNAYRGTGVIAGRVRFNQADPRKRLFEELLRRLLSLGVSAGCVDTVGCRLLFTCIRENLQGWNEWTEIMVTRICLAMQLEFGWRAWLEFREQR